MNTVALVGRLTRDPEVRYSADNQLAIARFTVAVDRPFSRDEQQNADFIPCVTFGKSAEFVERYFTKGMRIGLTGRIQTGSYTNKDGNKVYTTEVVADRVEFVESKGSGSGSSSGVGGGSQSRQGSDQVPEGFTAIDDDDMPF